MNLIKKLTLVMASILLGAVAVFSQTPSEFVVLNCESPGSLQLSKESLTAPFLKVTGRVDARDFALLKTVTINVTHVLDLSEADICEYTGTEGCKSPGTQPDWMVGNAEGPVTYPADYFPIHAFVETRDNSLSKFRRGSYSLCRIVLPRSLRGFMRESLSGNPLILELDVAEGSQHISQHNGLILSADGTKLLQVPPGWVGDVIVPASVSLVADGVLETVFPASVTFQSVQMPSFGDGNDINAAYIVAPDPTAYAEKFPNVGDCISSMEVIEIKDVVPSGLLASIGNLGYSRSDVRAVKASGTIGADDLVQLFNLPNLHSADLSECVCEVSGGSLVVASSSLTSLKLPTVRGFMSLRISTPSRLFGDLVIPEGFYSFNTDVKRFTSIEFPASLQGLGENLLRENSPVERLDFSKCRQLEEIDGFAFAGRLTDVAFPPNLTKIDGLGAPLRNVDLPASVSEISSYGGWLVENLVLPASLRWCSISSLPLVKNIDASAASSLLDFNGLVNAPFLQSLDLSDCPVANFCRNFCGDEQYVAAPSKIHKRVVATGGSRYPVPNIVGIVSVKLPSTVARIQNSFTNCPDLESLDLMGCFRLEKLEGIINCPKLHTVTLPESSFAITGFSSLPSLSYVKSAAVSPPQVPSDSDVDFSKVGLDVPSGSAGAYRMAAGWEKCASVNSDGFRVSIDTSTLRGLVDDPSLVLLAGAGLYPPGSETVLYAAPASGKEFSGWSVNGTYFPGNPMVHEVSENISAYPTVKVDSGNCDIVFDVEAPIAQTLTLSLWGTGNKNVILDGQHVSGRSQDNYATYFDMNLAAGNHTVMIAVSSENQLSLDVADESILAENLVSITSFKVNSPEALRSISASYFKMDELDVSGSKKLERISCFETNNIGFLKASDCPKLKDVTCWHSGISGINIDNSGVEKLSLYANSFEKLAILNHKSLKTIDIHSNQLRNLDLRGADCLETIDAEDNKLTKFSMTSRVCSSLSLRFNPMAFSTLTPLMYDIYMNMWKNMEEPSDVYRIIFKPDKEEVNATGLLDLSSEMYPLGSNVRNQVEINGEIVKSENGIFSLPYGSYTINLTNEEYPGLVFTAYVSSTYVKPVAPSGVIDEVDGIVYYFWSDNPENGEGNRASVMKVDDYFLGIGVPQYSGIVQIPPTVEYEGFKYSVTEIIGEAFADCLGLEGIGIPHTINYIGSGAFMHDENLKGVYITDLEAWMNMDFSNSSYSNPLEFAGNLYLDGALVKEVVVPDGFSQIKRFVFSGCTSIENVVLPEGVVSVENCAFNSCVSLADVTLPSTLKRIAFNAFGGCKSLVSISLPSSLTDLGDNAFSGCDALAEIEIPSGITEIPHDLFWHCDNLKKVSLPEGINTVDYRAFGNCVGLEEINLPSSLKNIRTNAFYNCVSLKNQVLPENLDSIGVTAFYGAPMWRTLTIPASVKSLGSAAFDCRNLKVLSVMGASVPEFIGLNSPFMEANHSRVAAAFLSESFSDFADEQYFKWFVHKHCQVQVKAPDGLALSFAVPELEDEDCPWADLASGMVICVPEGNSVSVRMPDGAYRHYTVCYNGADISDSVEGGVIRLDNVSTDGLLELASVGSVDALEDEDAEEEYYTLQGIRVKSPAGGIFIRRQGSKSEMVVISE